MAIRSTFTLGIAALLSASLAGAGDEPSSQPPRTLKVGGRISFEKNAPIFVRLVDLDGSKKERVARELVIELTAADLARGQIPYGFADLAPGRYAIKCFQDLNGNRKIDIGLLGPKEPWATYRLVRPKLRPPRFEEMAFDVVADVVDADLALR